MKVSFNDDRMVLEYENQEEKDLLKNHFEFRKVGAPSRYLFKMYDKFGKKGDEFCLAIKYAKNAKKKRKKKSTEPKDGMPVDPAAPEVPSEVTPVEPQGSEVTPVEPETDFQAGILS